MSGFLRNLLAGTTVAAFGAAVLVGATGLAYLKSIAPTLPDHTAVSRWKPSEGTKILAADGSTMGVHARERREFVPLEAIPDLVVNAFLAAEDGNYWTHSGVDPTGVARAAISNLKRQAGRAEGGSTITQQVVKNLLLGAERSIDRKIREAILAMRIDRDVGKRKVLEVYLNEIYLGSGAYGVAEAARTYFGKSLADLTPAEAATIAGLPKAPGTSSPNRDPARATERRNYVIGRMEEEGFLGRDEAAAAVASPMRIVPRKVAEASIDPALWYPEEEARRRLLAQVGGEAFYGKGGEVVTTIRPDIQRIVHASLRRGIVREDRRGGWRGPLARGIRFPVNWGDPRLAKPKGAEDWKVGVVAEVGRDAVVVVPGGRITLSAQAMAWASHGGVPVRKGDAVLIGDLGRGPELVQIPEERGVQGAAVVLDPASGDVLALGGGFSAEMSEFNRATQARRQTGSVFKTFVYLAALELGYDATSPVLDSPIALEQGPGQKEWRPKDSTGRGQGLITMRRSLEQSRNMSTVRLLYDIGVESVRSVASRVGFAIPERMSYAMALGASEATPLDVAAAYAAIANGGRRVAPRLVRDAAAPSDGATPVDPIAAAQVTSILRGVVTNGTAKRAFEGFPHPVAAKTGTTNDSRDAWLVAYGPRYVVAVWIGRDDFKPLAKGASGGGTAAPVARDILDRLTGIEFADFPLPEGAEEARAKRETGELSEDGDVVEIVRAERVEPPEPPKGDADPPRGEDLGFGDDEEGQDG